jgi:UDP-glucuronate 4-epimerase
MRALVTGVAGFVGSAIAERLLAQGAEVVGVDCFLDYYPRALKDGNLARLRQGKLQGKFTFHEMNLASGELLPLFAGVDVVFHQAAQAGVRKSWGGYFSTYLEANVLATQRLLETIRNNKISLSKFVYASSSSVYGNAERLPTSEKDRPQPVSPYGVTKLAAEHLCVLYATEYGIPTSSLRYFTVYGPGQRPDMAFYKFILAGLEKRKIEVYGTGEQSRDFTFIDDVVDANLAAAAQGKPGSVYNIGGGSHVTVNQALEILESHLGKLSVERLARAAGDAAHTGADAALARSDLGFAPKVGIAEGLEREIGWLRRQLGAGLVARL